MLRLLLLVRTSHRRGMGGLRTTRPGRAFLCQQSGHRDDVRASFVCAWGLGARTPNSLPMIPPLARSGEADRAGDLPAAIELEVSAARCGLPGSGTLTRRSRIHHGVLLDDARQRPNPPPQRCRRLTLAIGASFDRFDQHSHPTGAIQRPLPRERLTRSSTRSLVCDPSVSFTRPNICLVSPAVRTPTTARNRLAMRSPLLAWLRAASRCRADARSCESLRSSRWGRLAGLRARARARGCR